MVKGDSNATALRIVLLKPQLLAFWYVLVLFNARCSAHAEPAHDTPRFSPQVDIGRHSVSELCFEVLAHLQQLRQSNHNLYIIIIHVPQNLFCESRRLQRVVCCFLRSEKEGSLTGWRRSAQHWNAIIQHHRKTVRAVCDLRSERRNELQMIRHCDLVLLRN